MERPPGPLASGDYWATPAVGPGGGTAPLATNGRRRTMSDDTAPKLLFVRLYLGEHKMDVGLFDPILGGRRLVKYTWKAKDASDTPPKGWHSAVLGEVQYQQSQELKKRTGRYTPRE